MEIESTPTQMPQAEVPAPPEQQPVQAQPAPKVVVDPSKPSFDSLTDHYFFPEHNFSVEAHSLGEANQKLANYLSIVK